MRATSHFRAYDENMRESDSPKSPAPNSPTKNALGATLAFLIFIEVTSGFVQGYYTPLLPEFAKHLGTTGEAMNWFQTAQAMAAAVTVPLMARLGDIYGHRKFLRIAILLVLVGTVGIALLPTLPLVLIARVFVGPLGVWLPLAIAIVYVRMSGQSSGTAISILSASLMAGTVLGTISAGLIDAIFSSMTAIMLVPVVLVLVSAYAVFFRIPETGDLAKSDVDWLGFAGLGAIMVVLIAALAYLGPTHAVLSAALFFAGAALLVLWILWERRVSQPAVDLGLVTSGKLGPLYVTGFLVGILVIDAPANLSDFMSRDPQVYGYGFNAASGLVAGMITLLLVAATLGAFASAFIARKTGMRPMLIGATVAGAFGQLILVAFSESLFMFWISGAITGLGMGLLLGSLPALVAQAAPSDKTGIATGLYNALLAMGGAVGGAVFKQLLVLFRDSDKIVALPGYLTIWAVCAGVFVIAAWMMAKVKLAEGEV